jgi:hypothetical protein
MLTPTERHLRARAAAYALHAQGGTSTHAGTAAFLARFERQVDPDETLPPDERARRAAFARKSYMAQLSLRAAKARRLGAPSGRGTARTAVIEGRHRVATPAEAGRAADNKRAAAHVDVAAAVSEVQSHARPTA